MRYPKFRSKVFKSRPKREVKKVIFIVCEGACTEPNYFEEIKREKRHGNIHIKIKGRFPDPKTLFTETQKLLKQKSGIDKVYCIFDCDGRSTFQAALALISRHNKESFPKIEAITSNPCFEVWFLLHHKYSTKPYDTHPKGKKASEAIIADLRKYFPGYKKNSENIYQKLKDKTSQAIKNAEKLAAYQGHDRTKNPHTDVYKLVKVLLRLP